MKNYLLVFLCFLGFNSMAQKEKDFYKDKINEVTKTVDLVVDYNVNNQDNEDDSKKLQKAINDLSSLKNGGVINIPAGQYYINDIVLKSNVHLVIDKGVTLYATNPEVNKNFIMISFGNNRHRAKNVSIRSKEGMYTADLSVSQNKNVRVINVANAENFLIEGLRVADDNTIFSAITLNYSSFKGNYSMPENGVIKNCRIEKSHYGYGLIQAQASKNIYYENIWGDGGVTLRLETSLTKMNDLQIGGNHDTFAKNVYCENGNAAVMLSPHNIQNGHVEIDGIETVNCGFTVRISKGYIAGKQTGENLMPGTYANTSKLSNIKSTYGTTAQVKSKHFKYMTCKDRKLINGHSPDGISYVAPSVAPIINTAKGIGGKEKGYWEIKIKNISTSGYVNQKKEILHEEDAGLCQSKNNK